MSLGRQGTVPPQPATMERNNRGTRGAAPHRPPAAGARSGKQGWLLSPALGRAKPNQREQLNCPSVTGTGRKSQELVVTTVMMAMQVSSSVSPSPPSFLHWLLDSPSSALLPVPGAYQPPSHWDQILPQPHCFPLAPDLTAPSRKTNLWAFAGKTDRGVSYWACSYHKRSIFSLLPFPWKSRAGGPRVHYRH